MRFTASALGLMAALLAVNAALALHNAHAVTAAEARVAETQAVRLELDSLLSAMKDAETGERGFLLTGRDAYLEPYRQAFGEVHRLVATITHLAPDGPEQAQDIATIRTLVKAKLAMLEDGIALLRNDPDREHGFELARNAIRSEHGKALVDQLRQVIARMNERQRIVLDRQTAEVAARRQVASATTVTGLALGLLLVGIALVLTRRGLAAANAAFDTNALLEAIVKFTPAATCLIRGSDRRVLLVNPAYRRLLPADAPEAALLMDVWPETRASFDESCRRVLATGEPHRVVDQIVTLQPGSGRPASRAWFTWSLHRVPLAGEGGFGLLNTLVETTEQKRAERAVAENEAMLRLFIEHAPASLAMFDRDMRYLEASRRWRSDYALGDRDLRGVSQYDVFPEIGEEWKGVHRRALAGEVIRADSDRFVRADGSVQSLRWEVRPWRNEAGDIGGIMIFTEDISELTRALEDARKMTQWLHVAQVAAGAGTWQWNLRTNENVWSDEVWQLYGLSKGAAKPSYETWLDAIVEEDREAAALALTQGAASGAPLSLEFRVKWPDGSVHYLLSRGAPLRSEERKPEKYLGIVIDVTERKQTEALLRKAEQERTLRELYARLATAVESIQDALALFDENDRLVLCNGAYARLVGDSVPAPLVGKRFEEMFDAWTANLAAPDGDQRPGLGTKRLAEGRAGQAATLDLRTRDGRTLRVTDHRTPEGGIVETVWDLTEDERRAAELVEARKLAEAGNAAKTDFLSSMSHELRTPLNAVLGFAQLLQRDKKEPLSERHRERVEEIVKGGEHLLRLIDDILDLSRIEAGRVAITMESVDLAEVLRDVKRTLEPMAARRGVKVVVTPVPAGIATAAADRTRFAQILINFGSNAIKYNRPDGRVELLVSMPRPGFVRAAVRDTGIGIPIAQQPLLFQPFQRIGQETGPIEGTGIGLVITKRLAELMNGDVGFRSTPGEGSEFWVDMPASVPDGTPLGTAHPREQSFDSAGEKGRRLILYVEDDGADVSLMQNIVSDLEVVDLVTAPTAETGLALAKARLPAVIILDLNLPGIDGFAALRTLRAASETARIPIIALTGTASERDERRGREAGFDRYLAKPLDVGRLHAELKDLLAIPGGGPRSERVSARPV